MLGYCLSKKFLSFQNVSFKRRFPERDFLTVNKNLFERFVGNNFKETIGDDSP